MDADSIIGALYAIKDLQSLQIKVLKASDSLMTDKYGECTLKNYKLGDAFEASELEVYTYKKQASLFKGATAATVVLLILSLLKP